MNVITVRKSNLNEVCRVCLSPSNQPFTNIFACSGSNFNGATIATAVMECAPVHIVEGDGLPSLICNSCNNNLEISHQFRTLCVRSETILQRYIAQINATNNVTPTVVSTTPATNNQTIATIDIDSEHQQQDTFITEPITTTKTNVAGTTTPSAPIQQIQLNSENTTIYIKQEDCMEVDNNAVIQQIQTYQQQSTNANKLVDNQGNKSQQNDFNSVTTATVLKQEIIAEANTVGATELKIKLENTDGNCYQLQGAIENACFSTDQTQEIQYRFFNPIVENTDGQIIKVNSVGTNDDKSTTTTTETATANNTTGEPNFESYLVKLFTKEEERPHKCNVCLKTFKRSSNLSEHSKVHSECRPYKCEVCQKWFKRSCDLAEHKRSHSNERPFKCTVCPKSFKRNCDLSEHMKIHTNERPFECDICHKGFKRNGQYLEHRRIHTGERPYECEVCHQHFRTSSKLSAHSRVHNEERNHKCSLCPKSFRSYKSLTIHSRVHLDN